MNLVRQCLRFLNGQALLPVLFASGLACTLYAGRVILSGELTFLFLVWNLFLAWIPYLVSLCSAGVYRLQPRLWGLLLLPAAGWLLFLPNAPYLVTDLIHLAPRPPVPLWYDLGLLATFAWAGLFLGLFSLRAMQAIVRDLAGGPVSWLFVAGVIGLSGLGIYIGRFLRWNSWDLFFHPQPIVREVTTLISTPAGSLQTLGVTILFAAFLLVCYLTLTSPTSPERT